MHRYPDAIISVMACGEKWPDGMINPAIENLIGAGAIMNYFDWTFLSPEAMVAAGAYEHVKNDIVSIIQDCSLGREVVDKGFSDDVVHSAQYQPYSSHICG